MGLIKKFDSFISEKLVAEVEPISKKIDDSGISKKEASQQVINRLSRIYQDLSFDEKQEVDKYFQK